MAKAKSKARKGEVVEHKSRKNGNSGGDDGFGVPALPADLMSDLQQDATDQSANVRAFGESNLISIKGGVFSFKGNNLGPSIDVVVMASASVNEYYEGAYDPTRKGVTPACYALSVSGKIWHRTPTRRISNRRNVSIARCRRWVPQRKARVVRVSKKFVLHCKWPPISIHRNR